MRRPGVIVLLLGAAGWLGIGEALAKDAADELDRAQACRRRGKTACTLRHAKRALEMVEADKTQALGALSREAHELYAEALALSDQPDDATSAYQNLLARWPDWRAPKNAEPRVVQAFQQARGRRIKVSLPKVLDVPRPPVTPIPEPSELAPPPMLYAPERLLKLDLDFQRERRFRLSVGGGVAFVAGRSADRLDPGVAAAVEFLWYFADNWALWLHGALTIQSLNDDVRVEPTYGKGLTTVSGALGVLATIPLGAGFELIGAAGVGGGVFGIREIIEENGVAIHAVVGARYQLAKHVSLRLDVGPTVFFPIDSESGATAAGHLNVLLRPEIRF